MWEHRSELTFSFYFSIYISGIIGLFVGITTYLQIQYTSSLSHNISGVMKNCIQSFMGAYLYHTTITGKGFLGILLVVGGSFSYALERIQNGDRQVEKSVEKGLLADQKSQMKEVHVDNESSEKQELLK